MTQIIATSDLHGNLPVVPNCDIYIIAGDILPSAYGPSNVELEVHFQGKFYFDYLLPYFESIVARGIKIVFCAGNHDFLFERKPNIIKTLPIGYTYLNLGKMHEVNGIKFSGHPYTKWFYDWAFNVRDELMPSAWESVPKETDILVVHQPPYLIADIVDGTHKGCSAFSDFLLHSHPSVVHCGHLHDEANLGCFSFNKHTVIANSCFVDENYKPRNKLMSYEYKNGEIENQSFVDTKPWIPTT